MTDNAAVLWDDYQDAMSRLSPKQQWALRMQQEAALRQLPISVVLAEQAARGPKDSPTLPQIIAACAEHYPGWRVTETFSVNADAYAMLTDKGKARAVMTVCVTAGAPGKPLRVG